MIMIEYVVGPLVAALISLKFTNYRVNNQAKKIADQEQTIGRVVKVLEAMDKETLRKMMVILTPMSKAVKQLQDEVGIQ